MKHLKRFTLLAMFAAVAVATANNALAQVRPAFFTWDTSPVRWSMATHVSPYGLAVVGLYNNRHYSGPDPQNLVLWDTTGTYTLGSTFGTDVPFADIATHTDISAGGHVITATWPDGSRTFFRGQAAYWKRGEGWRMVPFPVPTFSSTAAGVSIDGNVIVGTAQFNESGPGWYYTRLYRWDRRYNFWRLIAFGNPGEPVILDVRAVAAGGAWKAAGIVYRVSGVQPPPPYSFQFPPPDPLKRLDWLLDPRHPGHRLELHWETGTIGLISSTDGFLADFSTGNITTFAYPGERTYPLGISPEGGFVVGTTQYNKAWIWSPTSGMRTLPDPRPYNGRNYFAEAAYACTWDGREVVGTAKRYQDYGKEDRAVLWDTRTWQGWDLNSLYVIPDGYIECATDISPDGRYIVGYGKQRSPGKRLAFLLARW